MKFSILFTMVLLSFNSYASKQDFKEVDISDKESLYIAAVLANNNQENIGTCKLVFLSSRGVEVSVNQNGGKPYILAVSIDRPLEFLKFTTNSDMTKIISGTYGDYEYQKINLGTLKKPYIDTQKIEVNVKNCIEKSE